MGPPVGPGDPFGPPLPPIPIENELEEYCGGFAFDFWNCKGIVTTDENCCPLECIETGIKDRRIFWLKQNAAFHINDFSKLMSN